VSNTSLNAAREGVGGEDVEPSVRHDGSSAGHGVEQVLQAGPDLPSGRAAAHRAGAVAGCAGEVEQVRVLGVVELQHARHGLQDAVGGAAQVPFSGRV
jgi:hypothetical protein